ncbi:hypothetical protein GCM10027614_35220 [Micromonospora vulcania]
MRERLARREQDPARAEELVHSHSAGTGGWHAGEEMNPPAARQVTTRGGDVEGFAARKLRSDHIDAADLVLTATADQQEYVVALRPDAAARTFVLGEFGRLLAVVDAAALPPAEATPDATYARGWPWWRRPMTPGSVRRRCPPTIWTTRGVAATSASAGWPTRLRRRSTRWPPRCCPERRASFLRVWGKPGAKGAFRVILNGS